MLTDVKLKKAVIKELNWEPTVSPGDISVTAKDGMVTLTGHVKSYAEKNAAEAGSQRVRGVRAVVEKIDVRLPLESHRSDEQITAAALEHFDWDVCVPKEVKVKVHNGYVTLYGEVMWRYQLEAADWEVRNLFGVVGLNNLITVKPRLYTGEIRENIMRALHRSWLFDHAIRVSADGGNVRLSGTVGSPYERQAASKIAWAAPGAIGVENDIVVR